PVERAEPGTNRKTARANSSPGRPATNAGQRARPAALWRRRGARAFPESVTNRRTRATTLRLCARWCRSSGRDRDPRKVSMSKKQMIINYVPGEECRVAIVEDGRLEEFHAERMDGPSNHVGNIYVGKVMNVEQAIQAAFIDFGLEQNGFLHVSDVHPQY